MLHSAKRKCIEIMLYMNKGMFIVFTTDLYATLCRDIIYRGHLVTICTVTTCTHESSNIPMDLQGNCQDPDRSVGTLIFSLNRSSGTLKSTPFIPAITHVHPSENFRASLQYG